MEIINIPKGMLNEMPNINQHVVPWMIGNDIAKEVVGLQMLMNIKEEKCHSLLVGSPGSAKSDLLVFTEENHPNAKMIGKSTTSAGLRGKIEKFDVVGGVLRTGPERGRIICFDELDKTDKQTRSDLLEAMQNRTVTVTGQSGGKFYAIVNIIASANPAGSNWIGEPNLSQIPFDKALMSRFHIWVPFYDLPTDKYGAVGASFYDRSRDDCGADIRKLIQLAFTEASPDSIPSVEMSREQFEEAGKIIGGIKDNYDMFAPYITPRTVDGFISFCKAHARYRMLKSGNGINHRVEDPDIQHIRHLYERCIQSWLNY